VHPSVKFHTTSTLQVCGSKCGCLFQHSPQLRYDVQGVNIRLQEFGGNSNRDTERYHYFASPFVARYIRFHPVEWYNHVSMRAGLIGCPHHGKKDYGTLTCYWILTLYTNRLENPHAGLCATDRASWYCIDSVTNRRLTSIYWKYHY
jgi:hypothetical protein